MEQRILDVWLRAQALLSEREGMIAENLQRQYLGQSMAYVADSFNINANQISILIEELRS